MYSDKMKEKVSKDTYLTLPFTWHDYTLWMEWYASSSQTTVRSPHSLLQIALVDGRLSLR